MTKASVDTTVAEFVTDNPMTAAVFDRHGIDFCCGGANTLEEACQAKSLDAAEVLEELNAIGQGDDDQVDWRNVPVEEFVDHIVDTHHAYLRDELPRIDGLAVKVARVHGRRHPELLDIAVTFQELRADLESHLHDEEQQVFPAILDGSSELAEQLAELEDDHDEAGEALAKLRTLTGSYEPPGDACASYRALFAGLRELEADVHRHVHKENNILFPRVLQS